MRKFFLADDAFDSDDEYGRNNRYRDLDDDYDNDEDSISSGEESDNENENLNNEKLFEGSNLSLQDFSILFLVFASKYCLADNAKKALLDLLHVVLPDDSNIPSLYMIEKLVPTLTDPPNHYNLCSKCHTVLTKNCCTNQECELANSGELSLKKRHCYYVMNIESCLRKIVTGEFASFASFKN